jgi:hypothetical protein
MNIKLMALLIAIPLSISSYVVAEDARLAAPDATAVSTASGDCDDADRACSPAAGVDAATSSLSTEDRDEDCDGDACDSGGLSSEPSGMAINEKGLPGKKTSKPASNK